MTGFRNVAGRTTGGRHAALAERRNRRWLDLTTDGQRFIRTRNESSELRRPTTRC